MSSGSYVLRKNFDKVSPWKHRPPPLLLLDMELTERCNNNCIHCYVNRPARDPEAKKKELKTGAIKSILQEAASLGCMKVRFTGGEPLLRDDFEELYVFTRRLGIRVAIFTNATRITPHLAGVFSRIPPLEKMEVSVYGMRQSSYEAVTRTPGSYEAARRGIDRLLKHGILFVVKSAYLPANKKEVREFENWAATIPGMDHQPPTYAMYFERRYRKDSPFKDRSIQKLRVAHAEGLQRVIRDRAKYLKEMRGFCSRYLQPSGEKLFSCKMGACGGCVDAYGFFQPCMMLKHPDYAYDLAKGSLKDAFIHLFPKMREGKATNPDYLSRCAPCFLKVLCGQCPAKSWTEHGTLDTPVEYLCEGAHAQARYLGLINKHERTWEITDWEKRIARLCGKP